jgi:hypothetical protein
MKTGQLGDPLEACNDEGQFAASLGIADKSSGSGAFHPP